MRTHKLVVAAALLAAEPAAADVSARYVSRDRPGEALVVEANDAGDSRIITPSGDVSLTIDGEAFLVGTDEEGAFAFRWDDLAALIDETATHTAGATPAAAGEPAFVAMPRSGETVWGRVGRIWAFRRAGHEDEPGLDVVVSDDPSLAIVGRAFAGYLLRTLQLFEPVTRGSRDVPPADVVRPVLERGTVLRFGDLFELRNVATGPLPAEAFRLTVEPLSPDALRARIIRNAANGAAGRRGDAGESGGVEGAPQ